MRLRWRRPSASTRRTSRSSRRSTEFVHWATLCGGARLRRKSQAATNRQIRTLIMTAQPSRLHKGEDRVEPRFVLSGIGKSFPGVRALHNVSLSLYPGQVTALIGENGAGKSTLVKILTGIYQPDTGTISVDGKEVVLSSAHKAFELGITAIHQETVLFDDLSVAENIFLGHAPRTRFGAIDWKTMRSRARKVLDTMHARHIHTNARLRDLGIANKHLVAVARAMSIDASVVIMDEPTAALSAKEIEELYVLIEFLKSEGKAVLFISHKFEEVYRIADRYTVFRDGEMVGEGLLAGTTQDQIVRMMVGRAVNH